MRAIICSIRGRGWPITARDRRHMTSQWWPLLTAVSDLLYLYFRIWGGRLLMLPSPKAEYSYVQCASQNIPTYIHPFNGPLSGSTQVSQYQKGKTIWILLKQEAVSGNGISWAICKSAPCSRQITKPAPHHLVFYRPDALPVTQPTPSKHWRHSISNITNQNL